MLFAAGLGTRLKPFTDVHPKALATVQGRTLLEWNIRYLQGHGIYDVVVNVHHFADQIVQAVEAHGGWDSRITISDETGAVLETGGGLKKAAPHFAEEDGFVVMNVDALTNLDLTKMADAHGASDALATLAVMQRTSSRYLLFDAAMQLCGWKAEKTGETRAARGLQGTGPLAFTGVQILSGAFLRLMRGEGKFSLIDAYLDLATAYPIRGYNHTGDLFIDVGKPETLAQAAELFAV